MSAAISAPRDRVWRAISRPDEVVRWDARMESLLDPLEDYPRVGRGVRWRYRLGAVAVELRDAPLEVVPGRRLRSAIALGLFHFDETFSLVDGESARTRLTLKLVASSSVPIVGGLLDRFAVRRMAAEFVDTRLRAIQKWCEEHP